MPIHLSIRLLWNLTLVRIGPLFFNFDLEYAIRKAQENQERFELNGTHISSCSMLTSLIY
jgi:hypothetical protein